MEMAQATTRTFFILHSDEESSAPLRNRIVRDGGRAITATNLAQALLIARNEPLDDALIEFEFAGADEVVELLRERHVPYIFCSAESLRGLCLTAGEIPSTRCSATV